MLALIRWPLLLLLISAAHAFISCNLKWTFQQHHDSLLHSKHNYATYRTHNDRQKSLNSISKIGDSKVETKVNAKLLAKTSLLVNLWGAISYPLDTDEETDFVLKDYNLNRYDVEGFTKHFQACKDCAADGVFLMATQNDDGLDVLRLTNMPHVLLSDDGDDNDWGVYEQDEEVIASEQIDTRPIFPVEDDDEVIIADTKTWVKKGLHLHCNYYRHHQSYSFAFDTVRCLSGRHLMNCL